MPKAATFNVSFNDPGSIYASYYGAITAGISAAGATWSQLLGGASTASIEVQVSFDPNLPTALGGAPYVPVGTLDARTLYQSVAASELSTGVDPNGAAPDAAITIGTQYLSDWLWFDPDSSARTAQVPATKIDAESVFLHELGHALGFGGWRDGQTGQVPSGYESAFDRYVTVAGGNLYFTGSRAEAVYGGPVPLTYGDYGHVGNSAPRPGSDLLSDLMNGVSFDTGTRYTVSALDQAIVEDTQDPVGAAGSVSINSVTDTEGFNGTKAFVFAVTRTAGTAPFSVRYSTQDGTATTADGDYLATSGTLSFGYGENTKTISVTVNGDTEVEPDEQFQVVLSNPTDGATIAGGPGIGTIQNDDTVPAGSVSVGNVSRPEGNSGTTPFVFTVTRSGGTAPFSVDYSTVDGSATAADSDYLPASGTLSFGAGQNTQSITINALGDTRIEPDEVFYVRLSSPTGGASIGNNVGVGTIQNDDAVVAGSVAINNVSLPEGNSGTTPFVFAVTRSGGTAPFSVNFATADNTATVSDNDYLPAAGTLSFGAGENTKTLSVAVNGDTKVEPNEVFDVVLSNPTNGAALSTAVGFGTIQDDDAPAQAVPGVIAISSISVPEGDNGPHAVFLNVTRTGGTAPFSLNFATQDGTAIVADGDYLSTSGSISFGAGVNSQQIAVTVNGDTTVEADESFSVVLSNPTNGAGIASNTATVTLINDDGSAPVTPASIGVYRFFDTIHGTHFFTLSDQEKATLIQTRPDLRFEGLGLRAVNAASNDPNAAPVFRFFDARFGTHFLTASASERDTVIATRPDLQFEGTGFYEHAARQAGDIPVYRFFDTRYGTHFYTPDDGERATLAATRPDLRFEGIGFYAPS